MVRFEEEKKERLDEQTLILKLFIEYINFLLCKINKI